MRKIYLFLLLFIAFCQQSLAQQSLQHIVRRSHKILVYRIPADTAEKYVWKGISHVAIT